MAHAHQKNYTNRYSLHFSDLIPYLLNQASRVTVTINLDENSYIISNNSILLGKAVIVKETNYPFSLFFTSFVHSFSLFAISHIIKKNTQPSQVLKLAKDKSAFISRSFELVSFINKYINFSLEYFLGIQTARIQNQKKKKKKTKKNKIPVKPN